MTKAVPFVFDMYDLKDKLDLPIDALAAVQPKWRVEKWAEAAKPRIEEIHQICWEERSNYLDTTFVEVVAVETKNYNPMQTQWMASLLGVIARATCCRVARIGTEFRLFGAMTDIKVVRYLYNVYSNVLNNTGRFRWENCGASDNHKFAPDGRSTKYAEAFYKDHATSFVNHLEDLIREAKNTNENWKWLEHYDNQVEVAYSNFYPEGVLNDRDPLTTMKFEHGFLDGKEYNFAVGYKYLTLRKGVYFSPSQGTEWVDNKLTADRNLAELPLSGLRDSWLATGHGIYATKNPDCDVLRDYVGWDRELVKLYAWGTIIEGDTGWRAQHAKIVAVRREGVWEWI